jgi:hydrogenase expression/formation protein HypC
MIHMCLAIPGKITEIDGSHAIADFDGVRRKITIGLCDGVEIGKYVLVHAGYAIQIVNEEEALESISLWREMVDEGVDKEDII